MELCAHSTASTSGRVLHGRTAAFPLVASQQCRLKRAAQERSVDRLVARGRQRPEAGCSAFAIDQPAVVAAEAKQQAAEAPFNWQSAWYPVAFAKDLDKTKPHRFTLLKTPLVIWWDSNAVAWRAFKDQCPHRLVPLSEGRINQQGELECGYHGWSFGGNGDCTRIPQGGDHASPRACATSYACEERQGLVFVYASPLQSKGPIPDPALIPIVPELEDPSWVPSDTWRDLPYDSTVLLENVLDSSHVPFTHHVSMSNRNVVNNYDIKLLEQVNKGGFAGNWAAGPRGGTLGPQSTEFRPPGYMKHKLQSKTLDSLVIVYAVPMSPGRCRLINRNVVRIKGGAGPLISRLFRVMPGWMGHVGSSVLLEDDQIFLHHGELELASRKAKGQPVGKACYTPSPADTYVLALHRWLDKCAGGGPFGPINDEYVAELGPRLSREQLLDRWTQHTSQCSQCQKGLAQVTTAQKVLGGVQWALQVATLLCLATAAVTAAFVPASREGGLHALSAASAIPPIASALLTLLVGVLGSPLSLQDLLIRGAAFGVAALAAGGLQGKLEELRQRFYTGVYPPPRNVAKD